jgi:hypothetical protein
MRNSSSLVSLSRLYNAVVATAILPFPTENAIKTGTVFLGCTPSALGRFKGNTATRQIQYNKNTKSESKSNQIESVSNNRKTSSM